MASGSAAVQRRRGTAAQTAAFTGLLGEVTVNTDESRQVVHDGVTAGGWPAAKLSEIPSGTNPLPVTSGGTGGATPAAARNNLGAARYGANTDINSLSNVAFVGGSISGATVGASNPSTVTGTVVSATTSVNLPSYTVATLPAAGTRGRIVHCSNARMQTATAGTLEASGSGTGGLVTDNGTAWKIAGTNITVSA